MFKKMRESLPNRLLDLKIPVLEPKNVGFLEIVNRAEKENTLSDVYWHFLNPSESPDTSDYFLGALIDICESKISSETLNESSISFNRYEVQREYTTNGGRVDLVIKEQDPSGWALIIEAKINHVLDNDLDDYWDAFEDYQERRVGIVLGKELYREEEINHSGFISVTHLEWMQEVIGRLPESLNEKRKLYILDLYETTKNHSMTKELNDQAEFFFDHAEQVNLAIQAKREAEDYTKGQMQIAGQGIGLKAKGVNPSIWEYRDPEAHATLYYQIDINGIFNGTGKLNVMLIAYDCARELDTELRKQAELQKKGSVNIKNDGSEHHRNIAQLEIELSVSQIKSSFATYVTEVMSNQFEPIRKALVQLLKEKGKYIHGSW